MTKKEAAIVSAYTGYLIGSFAETHKYIEKILGRPVFTHEMVNEQLLTEIRQKSKADFCSILITEN